MSVKLLTEHHLKFLSLKGGCTGSSESTLVKMPHCWKSHATAHMYILTNMSYTYVLNGENPLIVLCTAQCCGFTCLKSDYPCKG